MRLGVWRGVLVCDFPLRLCVIVVVVVVVVIVVLCGVVLSCVDSASHDGRFRFSSYVVGLRRGHAVASAITTVTMVNRKIYQRKMRRCIPLVGPGR